MYDQNSKKDVYARVTNRIIEDLERGVRPWLKPWSAEHIQAVSRPHRHNGIPYQGINVLMLWGEAADKGYTCPTWLTFKQAKSLKAHVRKGEHGALVVYANTVTKTERNEETGDDETRSFPVLKGYTVFNAQQIEGLPEQYYFKLEEPTPESKNARLASAEQFLASTGATIRHGGGRAYYAPAPDYIQMPPFESFRDSESYYGVALHELTHWTGNKSRLGRDFTSKRDPYAREELVAELGAAFLCADLGITAAPREDHASYLEHWLRVLKADKRAIFSAASHASKAADYLTAAQEAEVAA